MKLASYLEKTGTTRYAFAKAIGVTPPYITALCAGDNWPGREVMTRIIAVTGGEVTANDFLEAPPERAAQ